MRRHLVAFALLGLATVPARAGWEEAVAAYNKGDYATAAREFRPFAEAGQANAQYILGWIYQNGDGVQRDNAEAAKWYQRAAEKGNVDAQYALGSLYAAGAGVPRDDAAAVKWFRKAAEQGKAAAQYILGYMLSAGEGAPRNEAEGLTWYRKAAEQGLADAQYALALGLAYGKGTTKDEQEANVWLRKAADQGNVDAAYLLGWNYANGLGTVADYKEAAKWYRLAAEKGNAEAQYHLAELYRDGKGVARDEREAMKLFKQSAEQDLALTSLAIDEYIKAGKPEAAFELGNVWLARHPDDVQLSTVLAFAAIAEARGNPAQYGRLAQSYGDKAATLIESGKRPASMNDVDWSQYREQYLPQLYLQLGSLATKSGNLQEARARLEQATKLTPRDPYAWYLLGQAYFADYEKLNAESKKLQGDARSEATAKAFLKLDQVIDAYAHAVGLSSGKDDLKGLHDPLLKDLTSIYDFRNGSRAGLDELIAKYRTN
jgi:TPR repeat protein